MNRNTSTLPQKEDAVGSEAKVSRLAPPTKRKKKYLLQPGEQYDVTKRTLNRWRKQEYNQRMKMLFAHSTKKAPGVKSNCTSDDESDTCENRESFRATESATSSSSATSGRSQTCPCSSPSNARDSIRNTLGIQQDDNPNVEEHIDAGRLDLNYEFELHSGNDENNEYDSDTDSSDTHSSVSYASSVNSGTGFDTKTIHGEKIMFPAAGLTVADVFLMITTFSTQASLTMKERRQLIKMIKLLAGPEFDSLNVSDYRQSRIYNPPQETMTVHYFCANEKCAKILISQSKSKLMEKTREGVLCDECLLSNKVTLRTPFQFMEIDVKYQLKLLLDDEEIQENLLANLTQRRQQKSDGKIRDICSTDMWKSIQRDSPGELLVTFNFNTDGAPLNNSSKRSFWPLQLHLNELSPEVRFKHIILAGLFLTEKEPKPQFMNTYFLTFMRQIDKLNEEGITFTVKSTGEVITVKFHSVLAPMDSVARPVVQNRLQFNGHYGCSWCYDHGLYLAHSMRYPLTPECNLRTHESHSEDIRTAENKGIPFRGVKGKFSFQEVPHLDAVWSFPFEYMHAVLLGIMKALWAIWTTPKRKGYLQIVARERINDRFMKIKRPQEIHRLPRPIRDALRWKASEWRSWLLYDSVPCLEGILDNECFKSYLLLVRSIHTLLGENITESDLEACELDLLQFVTDCERFYGKEAMTFNLHSLLHAVETVRRCGPLWAYSTFPFENGIFHFKQEFSSPNGIMQQISTNYLKKQFIKSKIDYSTTKENVKEYCHELFSPERTKNHVKSTNGVNLLGTSHVKDNVKKLISLQFGNITEPVKVFNRGLYNKVVLRSLNYKRPQRTDDTTIQLRSGKVVRIHNLLYIDNHCYLHCREISVEPFKFQDQSLPHLLEIRKYKTTDLIINPEDIATKVLHFTTGSKAYVAIFPNKFEIQ